MDGLDFAACIREVPVPEIAPGTVALLDNQATHRNMEAVHALQDHDCWFISRPPHSPDLSPIKQAVSKLKAHLLRIGAKTLHEGLCSHRSVPYDPAQCRTDLKADGHV